MSDNPELTFHGAARTVTGSCATVELGDARILIDCGLFQGSRSLENLNVAEFAFPPKSVDAVILTHAHIDHCGLLPKLVARGFDGPIFCTAPTAELLSFMLADSARIQEFEAQRRNRRRDRANRAEFHPIYTEEDARLAASRARPIPLEEWFEPAPGFRVRLWNAGHILGSASAEIEAGGVRMLFSGDLGPEQKAFHADPEGPTGLDYVVCESTYGDRSRPRLTIAERRDLLAREVNEALGRGGNLIVPSFALERTQELLLDIGYLLDDERIPGVPVFVDSPLAIRATDVFAAHAGELEDLDGRNVFRHPGIRHTAEAEESMRIDSYDRAIIIAASGMCEAGRVRHHLRNNLARPDSTVLFVGYQAQGTLGRVILEGASKVRISGEDIDVRARIRRIDSYSAHADRGELVQWVGQRAPISGAVFLDHGEPDALAAFTAALHDLDAGLNVVVPEIGARYRLVAGGPPEHIATVAPPAPVHVGRDWQNEYTEFATGLRDQLLEIDDPRTRERAIAAMRKVLDEYRTGAQTPEEHRRHSRPGRRKPPPRRRRRF
ncbi:MBL fold metallo-hydrolase [Rhodococcus pyridinivorans]|uniref:MBL fold metallo-hydrolase n=1 Tax=Rhodococcus pyridinivorans TaxID=103816 RepID=A0A7M2XHF3_9NOCA|nr:MBL fold metallo-hydrolase [Rhodococcus pyridinivorans]QOV97214.1 MBL fold metallo-hydrolase [Rhodococcus pyridinivorans]WMM71128.1 MBL fold metallo-hydrolase [Rhodococcus pyridinivorans]